MYIMPENRGSYTSHHTHTQCTVVYTYHTPHIVTYAIAIYLCLHTVYSSNVSARMYSQYIQCRLTSSAANFSTAVNGVLSGTLSLGEGLG